METIRKAFVGQHSCNGDIYQARMSGDTLAIGLQAVGNNEFVHLANVSRTDKDRIKVAWQLEDLKGQTSDFASDAVAVSAIESAAASIDLDG